MPTLRVKAKAAVKPRQRPKQRISTVTYKVGQSLHDLYQRIERLEADLKLARAEAAHHAQMVDWGKEG